MQTITIAPYGASERSTIISSVTPVRPRLGASAIRLGLLAGMAAMAPIAPSFAQAEQVASTPGEQGIPTPTIGLEPHFSEMALYLECNRPDQSCGFGE